MATRIVSSEAHCGCGRSRLALAGEVRTRFFCHCSICQAVYRAPCADVLVLGARAVEIRTPDAITFRRLRPPPAVQRGTCRACDAPVVGLLGPRAIGLAFVPARTVASADALPAPTAHLFYERRSADVDDALPKYAGYWTSELAALRRIVTRF